MLRAGICDDTAPNLVPEEGLVFRSTRDLGDHYAQSKATTLQKDRNFTQTFKSPPAQQSQGSSTCKQRLRLAKSIVTLPQALAAEQN